jgi:DNA-binding transcriptional regulator YiaG
VPYAWIWKHVHAEGSYTNRRQGVAEVVTAQEIRAFRRRLSLTQRELASLLTVRRETIARWEKPDGPRPQAAHLQRLTELSEILKPARGAA